MDKITSLEVSQYKSARVFSVHARTGIRVGLTPNTRHSDTPTPHRPQLTGPRDARETGEIRQRSGRPLAVPPWSPTQDRLASRLALGQARKDAA